MKNLFEDIPESLLAERIDVLAQGEGVRIERIISDGHASEADFWYDQSEQEWVSVLAGSGTLILETESGPKRVTLRPGDHVLIPAHQRHRVESTAAGEKTVWLAVFFGGAV